MKKIILLIVLFLGAKSFSQTNGITYQAVILNPSGEQLPGVNNTTSPMVNKNICLQFQFIDEFSKLEYQETIQTKTDVFGMVNLVIGSGNQTAGYAVSFKTIEWKALKKSMIVSINTSGSCSSFTEISNQPFTAVPFAFSAINAGNVTGVVAIENGGTNAITVIGAKTNLGLEKVNNTSDLDKPMSIVAQEGWNKNSNAISTEAFRAGVVEKAIQEKMELDATTARAAELALTNNLAIEVSRATKAETSNTTALATEATTSRAAELLLTNDLVTEATTARAAELVLRDNLATEVTTSRAAELVFTNNIATEATTARAAELLLTTSLNSEVSRATNTEATKEALVNKSADVTTDGASDVKYPTVKSVKTYVDASSTSNLNAIAAEVTRAKDAENTLTTNLNIEVSRSTSAENTLTTNLNVEITRATTTEATKEALVNKSADVTTDGASDVKYPTVKSVKTYVDVSSTSNSNAIAAEVIRAKDAENTLTTNLNSEVSRATISENTLTTNLNSEVSRATSAENTLTTNLNAEISRATTAEAIREALVNKSADVTTDGASDVKYPTVKSVKTYVDAISNTSSTALAAEVSRAITAETANVNAIATETTNRINADLLKANLDSPTLAGTPLAPTATAATNSKQIATTEYVTNAISTSGANFLPLTGGTLTGGLKGTYGDFSSNFRVSSLTLAGSSVWEFGANGSGFSLHQGGCCNRLTIDGDGKIGIGANYTPSYQLDVEGDGRFTSLVTATSFIKAGGTSSQFLKADGTIDSNTYAILASPTFTGVPVAPTAVAGVSSTQIATTAFVANAVSTAASGGSFVDLTSNQLIAGTKTFSKDLNVSGLTIGTGLGNIATNTALGKQSLSSNITGEDNIALGSHSLKTNTTGGRNTALGNNTLYYNNAYDNTAIGYLTLQNNTSGSYNAGIGSQALFSNTTGNNNSAMGSSALQSNTVGSNNTAMGINSLINNTSGNGNTAAGQNSLPSNTTGTYNVGYGVQSLEQNTTGDQNTAIGVAAIDRNTTGASNAVLGAFAGRYISDGFTYNTLINRSVLIGAETKPLADNDSNEIVIGYQAKGNGSNTIQLGNTSVTSVNTSGTITAGAVTYPNTHNSTAGQVLTTNANGLASWSTSASSGVPYTGATQSVDLGAHDLKVNGLVVGKGSGNGDSNVAIGTQLGTGTGFRNTGVGAGALNSFSGTSFGNNTGVGYNSLVGLTNGYGNTSIGAETMFNVAGNDNNTAIGNQSLISASSSDNTATGASAGSAVTTGGGNTFIGRSANIADGTFSNSTALGREAIANGSNTIQLGNTSVTSVNTSGTITAGKVTYPNTDGTVNQVLQTNGNGIASWTTIAGPRYASSTVLQDVLTSTTDSEIYLPGLGFRWNQTTKKLEIKGEANNNPQALIFYFSYHKDGSNTINFRPATTNSNTNSWTAVDDPQSNTLPLIEGYYSVYDFDFTVYPLNQGGPQYGKTYNVKILLDGWGAVHMRAAYY
jgi:hypothetical protein